MANAKLALRTAAMNESATLALNARAKQMEAEGQTIYNLTAGELASDTPKNIQLAVSKVLDKNKYTAVAGMPELRKAIADHAQSFYGLGWVTQNNIVVTSGAKPALYATFLSLINPGDEVIIPTPAWVSYVDLIHLVGGVVVEVPLTDEYDLNPSAIKSAITDKTKAILINSPHNPTGSVFSEFAITSLAKLAETSDITIISDDIYTQLVFDDNFFLVPRAGFKNLVIINGFSKSQALTGWRIGYLIADDQTAKAATNFLSHITGNAPLPSQYAALEAMRLNDRPPQTTINDLIKKRQLVSDKLSEISGLKHNFPGGAFYIYLDLRKLTDSSIEWCEKLLNETGVVLVPGDAFLTPGFARLTFVGDTQLLNKAIAAIKSFVLKDLSNA